MEQLNSTIQKVLWLQYELLLQNLAPILHDRTVVMSWHTSYIIFTFFSNLFNFMGT